MDFFSAGNRGQGQQPRQQQGQHEKQQQTNRNNPELWEKIKTNILNKEIVGTKAHQWSARKAQLAVKEYIKDGGGYLTPKDPHNSLVQWSHQKWKTKSGLPSNVTHERYLPERAINALSDEEYKKSSEKKKKDFYKGIQYSKEPDNLTKKISKFYIK